MAGKDRRNVPFGSWPVSVNKDAHSRLHTAGNDTRPSKTRARRSQRSDMRSLEIDGADR